LKCQKCAKEIFLPFRCPYCGGYFCSEHRLPENHDCPRMELARAPRKETLSTIAETQKPYESTFIHTPSRPKGKIIFSEKEVKHLTVGALLVVGIGFSLGLGIFSSTFWQMSSVKLVLFTIMLTASFFMHEMAHKVVAQRNGFWAEFRLMFTGAILTLLSIISPFKIISPGAVMVAGPVDRENMGRISIAGPSTNIILAVILLTAASLQTEYQDVLMICAALNSWIALFNLIPFGMFDGFKIFLWNKATWVLAFAASLVLTIYTFFYLF
jgi:Zn-dependent protease